MKFRTEILTKKTLDIELSSNFYSFGSCFANMIGEKLKNYKINCISNPFGIIYNPISLFNLLDKSVNISSYMVKNNGIWYNYMFHSDFRSFNQKELELQLNNALNYSSNQLYNSDVLIITFGTAFIYKHIESNQIVANCHKIPQKHFTKHLLSVDEITVNFHKMYTNLKDKNPDLKIILTVSPVRHIKDSIELNSVSKSILRLACHQLQNENDNIFYFPSYEIMLDDLRDYRFYKDDLLHPTLFAEDYIWDKFKNTFFDNKFLIFIQEWDNIKASLEHKSFNPTSENHQKFLRNLLEKLYVINKTVDCTDEIYKVKLQLI